MDYKTCQTETVFSLSNNRFYNPAAKIRYCAYLQQTCFTSKRKKHWKDKDINLHSFCNSWNASFRKIIFKLFFKYQTACNECKFSIFLRGLVVTKTCNPETWTYSTYYKIPHESFVSTVVFDVLLEWRFKKLELLSTTSNSSSCETIHFLHKPTKNICW